jgi:multiple sugar transport system substrate-binding protein/putative aldouronate transport system substrate-binding protein
MMLTFVPEEATPIVYGMNVYGSSRIWSIGAKTQYPELCMEIINWLATPEGRMTSEYGPQGICWDYDENGYTYGTELGKLMHNDKTIEFPEETGYFGQFKDGQNQIANISWALNASNPDSNGETYDWETWKSNKTEPINSTESDWREYTGANNIQEYLDARPYKLAKATTYSEGKRSDELKVVWEQVIKAIVDYSWKAIYAEDDKQFNAIVAELTHVAKSYGYDQCVEWSENEAAIRKELEDAIE